MLKLYCENVQQWRQGIADYYSIELKEAKTQLIRIFYYGGKPASDLPFLWKLKDEIESSIQFILGMD